MFYFAVGHIAVPTGSGLGVELDRAALGRLTARNPPAYKPWIMRCAELIAGDMQAQ